MKKGCVISSKLIFFFTWSDCGKGSSMGGTQAAILEQLQEGTRLWVQTQHKGNTSGIAPSPQRIHREGINNQSCQMNSPHLHSWRNCLFWGSRAWCPWQALLRWWLSTEQFLAHPKPPQDSAPRGNLLGWRQIIQGTKCSQMLSDTPAIEAICYAL